MKGALIALSIGIVLLIFLFSETASYSSGTIDMHLHDTYFVLSYAAVIGFVILFLGTCFSIGGIFGSHAKSKLYLVLLALFLSVDIYYIVKFLYLP